MRAELRAQLLAAAMGGPLAADVLRSLLDAAGKPEPEGGRPTFGGIMVRLVDEVLAAVPDSDFRVRP